MDHASTNPAGARPVSLPGTQHPGGGGGTSQPEAGLPRPGGAAADDAERLAKQGAEQIGREAREVKESAKQAASDAAAKAREMAGQTADQVRQQAGHMAAQLREKGAAMLDQQKSRAADLIGDCVAATRRAAQKLHDENDHNLAGYTDAIAERLDATGRYLREQDARQLVHDAADLARRRPEWVLGGAFVVGLALARFLKASRPDGAAYGSYRYDRPQEFDGDESGYRGAFGGPSGDADSSEFEAAYVGDYSGGEARAYSPAGGGSSLGDVLDDAAPAAGVAGLSGGSLGTPGGTNAATDSWAATGGTTGGATCPAPAEGEPTSTRPAPLDPRANPAPYNNPGGPLT